MLKATVQGLQSLRRPEEVAKARGKTIADVLPLPKEKPEEQQAEEAPAEEPEPVAAVATEETSTNDGR
jgi:hypothetical protein